MNKEFKMLLLKIASLPPDDQKWLLKQLTCGQKEQFKELQGNELLVKARRFCKLPAPEFVPQDKTTNLPAFCQELGKKPPLFIAIVLEHEHFIWKQTFLNTTESGDEINRLLNHEVKELKPDTKTCVKKHWQNQLSFSDQLENHHG